MMSKKLYEYLDIDQTIHCPGATEEDIDKFMDGYIDLVEKFGWQTGGMFHQMTEKEMNEKIDKEDTKEEKFRWMKEQLNIKD